MKKLKVGRTVHLRKDEPIDNALKRLKDRLETDGIIEEMRQHRNYENPAKKAMRKRRTQKQRWNREWHYDKREEVYI